MELYEILKASKMCGSDGGGSAPEPVLINKTITENGTYISKIDKADGYSQVEVDVTTYEQEYKNSQMLFGYLLQGVLAGFTIPDVGVTSLRPYCFYYYPLRYVELSSTMREISIFAFSNCIYLEELRNSESTVLSSIRSKAFENCTSLHSISLPSTLTTIASDAFDGCDSITINIAKPSGSISGAPWGATNATVNWTG